MEMARSEIFTAAMDLSPEDKAMLADKLLLSLSPMEDGLEKIWLEEIDRRLIAYNAGQSKPIPADEVFSELLDGQRKSLSFQKPGPTCSIRLPIMKRKSPDSARLLPQK